MRPINRRGARTFRKKRQTSGSQPFKRKKHQEPTSHRVDWSHRLTGLAAVGALLVSGIGVIYTGRSVEIAADAASASREQLRISDQGQLTERYSRGVEQLGSPNEDVRIGGILTLEQVATDSPARARAVRDVLNSFVVIHAPQRDVNNVPIIPKVSKGRFNPKPVPADIRMAMRALGRIGGEGRISLSYADLRGLEYPRANYSGLFAWAVDLSSSAGIQANLESCVLGFADLSFAYLPHASLKGCILESANLTGVRLEGADLRGADLTNATLAGAILNGADLRGTKVTKEQLATAVTNSSTKLPTSTN